MFASHLTLFQYSICPRYHALYCFLLIAVKLNVSALFSDIFINIFLLLRETYYNLTKPFHGQIKANQRPHGEILGELSKGEEHWKLGKLLQSIITQVLGRSHEVKHVRKKQGKSEVNRLNLDTHAL